MEEGIAEISGILQIILGSFALSIVHAMIPNHWLPLIAISKAEGWGRSDTVWITTVAAGAHTLSTIIIGIAVGLAGYRLSASYEFVTRTVAPSILIILGLIYIIIEIQAKGHYHHHVKIISGDRKSKMAMMASLSVAMFFSPCLEIEAYYFTAGTLGWRGIWAVSLVYFFATIAGIVLLVLLGRRGIDRLNWHFLEHHEKALTAVILITVGILAFFVDI